MEEEKKYVEFIYGMADPFGISIETGSREVKSIDYKKLKKIPERCYAYKFFEVTRVIAKNKEIIYGKPKYLAETYYPEAKIITLEEMTKELPSDDIQIRNMKILDEKEAIKGRNGHYYRLYPNHKIV